MLPVVTYPTAEYYYQHAKAMSLGLPGEADEILHADGQLGIRKIEKKLLTSFFERKWCKVQKGHNFDQ